MTIGSSLYFVFDGISSEDYGILNVNVQSGMIDENFLPEREVLKTKVRGKKDPFFHSVEYINPLQFQVNFAFQDVFDEDKLRDVARWLCKDFYCELYFSDNPDRRYYATYTGNPRLIHNGASQGYITLTFETSSPYTFSPIYETEVYDLSSNTSDGYNLTLTNYGDVDTQPIIYVEIVSGSTFSIVNNSDGGKKIAFSGLSVAEQLTIDCEYEDIESSLNVYRFDNMTTDSVFLNLPRGVNSLVIFGNVKLRFKLEYKTLQG